MNWLDSMVVAQMRPLLLYEATSLPGTPRVLTTIPLTPQGWAQVRQAARTRRGGQRVGFIYDILARNGRILYVGSSATLDLLISRLQDHRRSIPGAVRARIRYVSRAPRSSDPRVASLGGLDQKIFRCQELLRQYQVHRRGARRGTGLVNYDPRSWRFENND